MPTNSKSYPIFCPHRAHRSQSDNKHECVSVFAFASFGRWCHWKLSRIADGSPSWITFCLVGEVQFNSYELPEQTLIRLLFRGLTRLITEFLKNSIGGWLQKAHAFIFIYSENFQVGFDQIFSLAVSGIRHLRLAPG
jgi:hypothetical protein